jgi:hypothetical protein
LAYGLILIVAVMWATSETFTELALVVWGVVLLRLTLRRNASAVKSIYRPEQSPPTT